MLTGRSGAGSNGDVTPLAEQDFFAPLFDLLKTNNDKDPYLRHAAVMGLVHAARNPVDLWNAWTLAKAKYDIPPVRMGVLLALRKHGSDKVAEFLTDAEPRIVAEAARAIYDDRMMNAFPALAKLADYAGPAGRGCVPRAGRELLARHARGRGARRQVRRPRGRAGLHPRLRAQAPRATGPHPAAAIRSPASRWTSRSATRKPRPMRSRPSASGIFAGSDVVRREAAQVVAKLGIKEFGPAMAALVKDAKQPVSLRVEALYAVDALRDPASKELAAFALGDRSSEAPRRGPRA